MRGLSFLGALKFGSQQAVAPGSAMESVGRAADPYWTSCAQYTPVRIPEIVGSARES